MKCLSKLKLFSHIVWVFFVSLLKIERMNFRKNKLSVMQIRNINIITESMELINYTNQKGQFCR